MKLPRPDTCNVHLRALPLLFYKQLAQHDAIGSIIASLLAPATSPKAHNLHDFCDHDGDAYTLHEHTTTAPTRILVAGPAKRTSHRRNHRHDELRLACHAELAE